MGELMDAIRFGIPPKGAIGCCICGDKHSTLLVRDGKRICRKCYAKLLEEPKMTEMILNGAKMDEVSE